jgi:hypothetical protein
VAGDTVWSLSFRLQLHPETIGSVTFTHDATAELEIAKRSPSPLDPWGAVFSGTQTVCSRSPFYRRYGCCEFGRRTQSLLPWTAPPCESYCCGKLFVTWYRYNTTLVLTVPILNDDQMVIPLQFPNAHLQYLDNTIGFGTM